MRTTITIDEVLLREAKRAGAEQGKSLSRIIEDALRRHLRPQKRARKRFRLKLLTKKGRVVPGVNIADRDVLYERMEGRG